MNILKTRPANWSSLALLGVTTLWVAAPGFAQLPDVKPRNAGSSEFKAEAAAGEETATLEATREVAQQQPRPKARQDGRELPDRRSRDLPDVEPREPSVEETEFQANEVYLGIAVAPSEDKGVLVTATALNGPADRAGLATGDFILSVNGTAVDSTQSFQEVLAKLKPGTDGKIVVLREERKLELPIKYVSHKVAGFRPNEDGEYGLVEIEEPKVCLGVMVTDDAPDTKGVTIVQVHPDCAAAEAGLEAGDIIYSVNKREVKSPAELTGILSDMKPGDEVSLLVGRDGERQIVTTTLADRHELLQVNVTADDSAFADESAEHQLMVEQHRHFARQHQRLEELTLQLLQEVKELRKEVRSLNHGK